MWSICVTLKAVETLKGHFGYGLFCVNFSQNATYPVSQKRVNLSFALCLSIMNRFQYKLVDISRINTKQNCGLSAHFTWNSKWEIRSVRSSRQRNNNMYILMNHWIATNTTGNYCLSNVVKHVVGPSHIIFTLYARNVRLQRERKRV